MKIGTRVRNIAHNYTGAVRDVHGKGWIIIDVDEGGTKKARKNELDIIQESQSRESSLLERLKEDPEFLQNLEDNKVTGKKIQNCLKQIKEEGYDINIPRNTFGGLVNEYTKRQMLIELLKENQDQTGEQLERTESAFEASSGSAARNTSTVPRDKPEEEAGGIAQIQTAVQKPSKMCHLVLDRSGSMEDIDPSVFTSAKEFLQDAPLDSYYAISEFGSELHIDVKNFKTRHEAIEHLELHEPRGSTKLFDAIVQVLEGEEARLQADAHLTMIIVTDGMDNCSSVGAREKARELIEKAKKRGWRIVFCGSNQDAACSAAFLGITEANALTYGNDAASFVSMMKAVSDSNRRYWCDVHTGFSTLERQLCSATNTTQGFEQGSQPPSKKQRTVDA